MILLDQEAAAVPNKNLIQWMLDNHVGTAQLSRLANIDPGVLGHIVSGELDPALTTCRAITEACREIDKLVDFGDLFGGAR